jgi:hypothetical protein
MTLLFFFDPDLGWDTGMPIFVISIGLLKKIPG